MQEIIVYTDNFMPTKEYAEFAKSLGFKSVFDPEFRIDERALRYVRAKSRMNETFEIMDGDNVSGIRTEKGCAYILSVDTSRKWRFVPLNQRFFGYKAIEYIDVTIDSNGQVIVTKAN